MMIEQIINYVSYLITFIIFLYYLKKVSKHLKCFHKYGEWEILEKKYYDDEVCRIRHCKKCNKKQVEYYYDY